MTTTLTARTARHLWADGKLRLGVEPIDWTEGSPPVVSGASGTWSDGATITLSGSNFSSEMTQDLSVDFDPQPNGAQATGFDYWADAGAEYSITDASSPPIGTKAMRVVATQGSIKTISQEFAASTRTIFVEYWARINIVDGSDPSSGQIKLTRIVDGSGETTMQNRPTQLAMTYHTDGNWLFTIPGQHPNGSVNHTGYSDGASTEYVHSNTAWQKCVMQYTFSDLDTANGKCYAKFGNIYRWGATSLSSPSATVSETEYDGELIVTQTATNSGLYPRRVTPPYYQKEGQTSEIDVAHWIAADSPERVIIGDASTWAGCTKHLAYSIMPTSRSLNSITFAAKNSSLVAGNLYAYVVNHDNKINPTGIQVRAV